MGKQSYYHMKNIKFICMGIFLIFAASLNAAKISGYIYSTDKEPIADAVVSMADGLSIRTGTDGSFVLNDIKNHDLLNVWASGYFSQSIVLKERTSVVVYMIPVERLKYNETTLLPYRTETGKNQVFSANNIAKKDFIPGNLSIDRALQGEIAGLQVTNKSGMTGEGSYMNLRGLRSLIAENSPLIVLNGVPYMPSKTESRLINGYSRSVFQALNLNDIQDITVLKGADAAIYGSMGSNGVIMIETDGAASDDLNTKISYYGQFGVNWNDKRIPLLNTQQYKSYLSDIGMTYYDNMETFFSNFPFLTDPDNIYSYLYNNNTDWQDQIYSNGMVTDHLFRVEGGDAIAKYDISLGYLKNEGTLSNTATSRYHTQINTNVLVSKKVEIATTVGLSYLSGKFQEQGMLSQTNPLLAAYRKAPILSPYKSDIDGNKLDTYSNYYFGASNNTDFASSNPVAMINILNARNRQYDVNAKFTIAYKPTVDLSFNANLGLYYNYDQESMFIPGVNNSEILPLYDQYGQATNTVKVGVSETFNMFYNFNAAYKKVLNDVHALNVLAGVQVLTTNNEFDAGSGRNTPNDFYQTLGDVNNIGRFFFGYSEVWNWMSYYLHADHTFNNLLKTSFNLSVDGASSTGTDASRFGVFPSLAMTLLAKNTSILNDVDFINRFNVKAEYGLTGNSRFSSNYGKYFYTSKPYQGISGIIRANVPNTNLKWEEDLQLNVGFETSMFANKLDLSFGYYNTQASNVVMISPNSAAYGTGIYYSNDAAISSDGIEVSLQVSPINTKDFKWTLGGNLATLNNKVKSLGGVDKTILTLYDGSQLVTKVGENPYSFYGYTTNGVFSTTAEATEAGMKNLNGLSYAAGDVKYNDKNGDFVINDEDREIIGSATPDMFGGLYNSFEYKNFALDLNFVYSLGNEAYNAVRRNLESVSDFSNQSLAVVRRWTMEGQVTDVPRAKWGDAIGNNDFSDRWIEDASYLKLRDITLRYSFNKPVLNFFQSGTIYVTGQNLLTFTKYLGMDPEFAYSYNDALQGVDFAKVAQPKTVKVGFNLKF